MFWFISGWCYLLVIASIGCKHELKIIIIVSESPVKNIVTSAKQVIFVWRTCAANSINTAASHLHDEQNKGFKASKDSQGVQQR
jgi:hypothetical protein